MAIGQKSSRSLVTWRDTPAGGAHGVITHGLDTPHYVDIQPGGAWALLTLNTNDKPVFVERGHARNVAKAKRAAEGSVGVLIEPDSADATATKSTTSTGSMPWVRTVKIYFGLSLTVLAVLIFARWLLLHRPGWFVRVLLWGGSSLFIAHRLILWFVEVARRVDYLTGRKTTAPAPTTKAKQQPMKMPVLPSSKHTTNKHKALPSGKGRKR